MGPLLSRCSLAKDECSKEGWGVLNEMGFVKGVSLGGNQSNLFGNINLIR